MRAMRLPSEDRISQSPAPSESTSGFPTGQAHCTARISEPICFRFSTGRLFSHSLTGSLPDSVAKNRVVSGRGAEGISLFVSKMMRVSKSECHTPAHLLRSGSRNGFRWLRAGWFAFLPECLTLVSGYSCSLPRKPPFAWFPASARWHVFVCESSWPSDGAARLNLRSARRSAPALVFHSRASSVIRGHRPLRSLRPGNREGGIFRCQGQAANQSRPAESLPARTALHFNRSRNPQVLKLDKVAVDWC